MSNVNRQITEIVQNTYFLYHFYIVGPNKGDKRAKEYVERGELHQIHNIEANNAI